MQNRKVNEDTLNNLYKNAHIALQSISDILPETDDKMKKEIEQSSSKIPTPIANAITEACRNKEYTKGFVNGILKKYGVDKIEDIRYEIGRKSDLSYILYLISYILYLISLYLQLNWRLAPWRIG